MHRVVTAVPGGAAFHVGLVFTAFGFGFRHGIDWDHLAALVDITSSQSRARRSMFLATLYALGHALVVLTLGAAAIVVAARLPAGVDAAMERVVGATLVALGVYVFYALTRDGSEFRLRSRWMIVLDGARAAGRRLREPRGPRERDRGRDRGRATPADRAVLVRTGFEPRAAFGIGMLHGVGAETPTQVVIFVTAAGAVGRGTGLLLLACFLAGLLASNTVVAVAGTVGLLGAARNVRLYVACSIVLATLSVVIGAAFLAGGASRLPALFGG